MRLRDSSLTRVKPLFDFIDADEEKLNRLLGLFKNNTQSITKNSIIKIGYGDNEITIPPSKSLSIWMLLNLNYLNKVKNYGVENIDSETFRKRKLLFSGDGALKDEAIRLIQMKSDLSARDWFIFEGKTHPDIFIETTDSIFVGEAKRTEKDITNKTKWLSQRDQLIRHIDSLLDQSKTICSFYILDRGEYSKGLFKERMKLYLEMDYFRDNLRHRNEQLIERAMKSFIGYIFWDDISDHFNISFPDKISDVT
ncbi:MAG: hypothetical protein FD181_1085 [Prolixibacteraceae bacterium]|nr:MAG: hypothetical protein FD181_1085 [Prolixibacteraceae bacterium]